MTAHGNVHTGTSQLSLSTCSFLIFMVCAAGWPVCSDRVLFHWDMAERARETEQYS